MKLGSVRGKKAVIFFVRAYNDLDHLSPVMWACLNEGLTVKALVVSREQFEEDYRVVFLKTFSTFTFKRLPPIKTVFFARSKYARIFSEVFFLQFWALYFLIINRVGLCVFEWGGTSRFNLRGSLFLAAGRLKIPRICLPHGCNIYLNWDINDHIRDVFSKTKKWPDFRSRNNFEKYVVQSPFHRDMSIAWGQRQEKIVALGSARFYPEWIEINTAICPSSSLNIKDVENTKFIISVMLPHWSYNVFKEKCMETILRLASIPENYIILKCHTRGSGGLTNEELNSLCENQNVLIADNAIHSPFIIGISDCVICFGSSIGLEAMLRGVPHINPTYLHENSTIYEKSKISESVSNLNDLMTAIERIRFKKGSPQKSEVISSDPCINEVVYGGVEGRRVLNDYTNLIIESMNGK